MNQLLPPEPELLFVYGTLKRGLSNHGQLDRARFAGDALMPGIDLHDLGPFPMAIPGVGCAQGELYLVEASQLLALDRFEGVPRLYERRRLPLSDGRLAWIYLGRQRQVRHSARLLAGRWPAVTLTDATAAGDQDANPPPCTHASAETPP